MLSKFSGRLVVACVVVGIALGLAFGAHGDEPGRLVVCVVKDGESGAICMPLEHFMAQFGSRVCHQPTDAGVVSL